MGIIEPFEEGAKMRGIALSSDLYLTQLKFSFLNPSLIAPSYGIAKITTNFLFLKN